MVLVSPKFIVTLFRVKNIETMLLSSMRFRHQDYVMNVMKNVDGCTLYVDSVTTSMYDVVSYLIDVQFEEC